MSADVTVSVEARSDGTYVRVSGELDAESASTLRAALAAMDLAGVVVVDLQEVEFVDSTGLGALVEANKLAMAAGGRLILSATSARALHLFRLTGLDRVFELGDQAV